MNFVIITGASGAGRTRALRCLEDMGFYCVDNLPPLLISKFAEMCSQSQGKLSNVAVVVDTRSGEMFKALEGELACMKQNGYSYTLIFLDATDDVLIRRYKETRRMHPLAPDTRPIDGILKEREILSSIKNHADHVIDTSVMQPQHFKKRMVALFSDLTRHPSMTIDVISFGFKYGIPLDSDLVFDVRFLPNPFYELELKHKTGLDSEVRDFVMQYPQSRAFAEKLLDMVSFLIPQYIEEGKGNLVIAIGCTGGKHRSVTIASLLAETLEKQGNTCHINHRDITKK